ncbi:alpha-E domain-containing protein [Hoeflea prorocentri]|uniref:Alpha-E domain-containing protein n=1 Tax=Hoeflea prorocentri TaxID=1922333 RepID=A0A9X3UHU9_9HYPH|nr:alpha-E domain-containing protein [Hoeflea prorocentri]MCY6381128.1 alpha-E domain-containing protein [Hoeflea prorocentri]MDA5398928.1 alpha-E domain-containing protein [Hoeflea prorocentri]
MLSRAAESLFWLGRYMERAEATARMISMGQRMAMLPGTQGQSEWTSLMQATGTPPPEERAITEADIVALLILDPESPSAVQGCLSKARENGRAVRTALTQEMWESLNEDWRYLESMDTQTARRQLVQILEWVRNKAAIFRGAVETSMLRTEGYFFLRLGSNIERADMTLRLLNVKYFLLLPETEVVGGGRDHHQWMSMLHAVSGLRAYHHNYAGDYAPWNIADFLLLNQAFPRSVAFSYGQIDGCLAKLEKNYGGAHNCQRTARAELNRLSRLDIHAVFSDGLHEFINDQIAKTARISKEVSDAYHF